MPISFNKLIASELSNGTVISPFRNITWPTSVFIHNKTPKVGKIHSYNDIQKIAKPLISHLLLILLFYQMAYLKIGKHAHLNVGIKQLLSLLCMNSKNS